MVRISDSDIALMISQMCPDYKIDSILIMKLLYDLQDARNEIKDFKEELEVIKENVDCSMF